MVGERVTQLGQRVGERTRLLEQRTAADTAKNGLYGSNV